MRDVVGGGEVRLQCDSLLDPQSGRRVSQQQKSKNVACLHPEVVIVVVVVVITLVLTLALPSIHRHLRDLENAEEKADGEGNNNNNNNNRQDHEQQQTSPTYQPLHNSPSGLLSQDVETMESLDEAEGLESTDVVEGEVAADVDTYTNSVAFLLPLRGQQGALGLRLGRGVKRRVEGGEDSSVFQQDVNTHNFTNYSSTSKPTTTLLVRDTRSDPDAARQLTEHFYQVHGIKNYFGFLTDEEAFTVAHWARGRAPGARFVTPTATSIYLDDVRNIVRVQPSARLLAATLANLLGVVGTMRPLVVARTSIHNDIFIRQLIKLGVRPVKVMRYYPTTNMNEFAEKVKLQVSGVTTSPLILLGDAESWNLVTAADKLFPAVWILPFLTQMIDNMQTNQSEILVIQYRAYDPVPNSFMKTDPLLAPDESIVTASHKFLTGTWDRPQGVYIVAAKVAVNSLSAGVRLLGTSNGWVPLLQYQVSTNGITRRLYRELLVTKELLQPFVVGEQCRLVLRYVEELTGVSIVTEAYPYSALPTLLLPADRGAQLHIDCPKHHTDLRCWVGSVENDTLTCRGTVHGSHDLFQQCGPEVSVSVAGSQGCTAAFGFICRGGRSLGCLLSGLCSSLTHSSLPLYQCGHVNLHGHLIPH
ncbi:hypothetical protein Pmani_016685 [Petrolisthes manimaculis]|uniref:Uncharacterized protein n=1 Tax=Petrolisthes manimaculis TaxID=1843537 RepID=A0AAE1PNE7_9EUCA|nr:hypothetical protein Pmani_016685 [Petrolisthes manimaculis]